MVAAAADAANFPGDVLTRPVASPSAKKIGPRVCTNASFMLWSGLMSAEPRSDRRVDQGEENEKGNTHKGSRSTSMMSMRTGWDIAVGSFLSCGDDVIDGSLLSVPAHARARHDGGLIATDRRSPRPMPFLLLPVSGRAGARASTAHVALTRVRRRRIASSGRPGESR